MSKLTRPWWWWLFPWVSLSRVERAYSDALDIIRDSAIREHEHGKAAKAQIEEASMYECTVCGRVGTVGRCCGLETRRPYSGETR